MNSRFKKRVAVVTCITSIALLAVVSQMPPQTAPPALPQIRPVCEQTEQTNPVPIPHTKVHPVEPVLPESDPQLSPLPGVEFNAKTETPPMSENPPTLQKPPSTQAVQPPAPSAEPKMGDTRISNGQKQVYFLGFGWIEDNDAPNEGIYAEDMYENGNKIGVMGGGTFVDGDGDINKMVGTMGGQGSTGCSESERP